MVRNVFVWLVIIYYYVCSLCCHSAPMGSFSFVLFCWCCFNILLLFCVFVCWFVGLFVPVWLIHWLIVLFCCLCLCLFVFVCWCCCCCFVLMFVHCVTNVWADCINILYFMCLPCIRICCFGFVNVVVFYCYFYYFVIISILLLPRPSLWQIIMYIWIAIMTMMMDYDPFWILMMIVIKQSYDAYFG